MKTRKVIFDEFLLNIVKLIYHDKDINLTKKIGYCLTICCR